jgi:hypothetical protein
MSPPFQAHFKRAFEKQGQFLLKRYLVAGFIPLFEAQLLPRSWTS